METGFGVLRWLVIGPALTSHRHDYDLPRWSSVLWAGSPLVGRHALLEAGIDNGRRTAQHQVS